MMLIAETILRVVFAYGSVGLLFAGAFLVAGISRVDAVASGSPLLFRFIILPGTVALWPVMAAKWMRTRKRGVHS